MITIGRVGCDIVIPDESISRKHATISLVDGQYVYNDLSKNGTTINGRFYQNEKVVIAPGTPVFLAGKILLPWAQVLMLLPNAPVTPVSPVNPGRDTVTDDSPIGVGYGILSFLIPIVGWVLYFSWKDTKPKKAKQASTIAWISFAINILAYISM